MGGIIILISFAMCVSFTGVCFYHAWYKPIAFEQTLKAVDQSIDDGHILWYVMLAFLVTFTVSGSVYSWYQF